MIIQASNYVRQRSILKCVGLTQQGAKHECKPLEPVCREGGGPSKTNYPANIASLGEPTLMHFFTHWNIFIPDRVTRRPGAPCLLAHETTSGFTLLIILQKSLSFWSGFQGPKIMITFRHNRCFSGEVLCLVSEKYSRSLDFRTHAHWNGVRPTTSSFAKQFIFFC